MHQRDYYTLDAKGFVSVLRHGRILTKVKVRFFYFSSMKRDGFRL